MSNNVEDLELIQAACKRLVKELNSLIIKAESIDDPKVITRLQSAQSKLLFAKFAVNQLLVNEFVEVKYDDGECSSKEFCHDCPC